MREKEEELFISVLISLQQPLWQRLKSPCYTLSYTFEQKSGLLFLHSVACVRMLDIKQQRSGKD